ncbi:hypothetical protein XALC_2203 [Xanthomonas albilineans GPE PC73]|uniref:Uncharacterized protein n=1 Tax=Xanthomonas albilineans (strain GPE PC73 / CFBP 7063) TaxID=380358 RepID=D2UEU0_XANAP|nr:hypothetical protein XALC_2203 [Xanthomonas albilineans GPE PC73]
MRKIARTFLPSVGLLQTSTRSVVVVSGKTDGMHALGHDDTIRHHSIGQNNARHALTSNASPLSAARQSSNVPHVQQSTSSLDRYRRSHAQAIYLTSSWATELTPIN